MHGPIGVAADALPRVAAPAHGAELRDRPQRPRDRALFGPVGVPHASRHAEQPGDRRPEQQATPAAGRLRGRDRRQESRQGGDQDDEVTARPAQSDGAQEQGGRDGDERHVDLELATRNYRAAHIQAKSAAGFRVYADTSSHALAAALDNHDVIAELLRM